MIVAPRVEAFSAPSHESSVVSRLGQGAPVGVLDATNHAGVLLHRVGWLAIRVPGGGSGAYGSRTIDQCVDCREDHLEIAGGTFWRVGVDLSLPSHRLRVSYGLTVAYERYLGTAGLRTRSASGSAAGCSAIASSRCGNLGAMRAWRWVAAAVLIGACGIGPLPAGDAPPANQPQPPLLDTITAESRIAMRDLAAVKQFALGAVGYEGVTSTGETLTLELAQRPDALEAFSWLVSQGTPIARLYAYWALRTLAPDRAATHTAALEADPTVVKTLHGCIGTNRKVRSIALRMKQPNDLRPMPQP